MTTKGQEQHSWTDAEVEALRNGARSLPGRSKGAVREKRSRLGIVVGNSGSYSQVELDLLRTGATSLPGRSYQAVHKKRAKMGLVKITPRWTDGETGRVLSGARTIPGRSVDAVAHKRSQFGITSNGRRERPWSPHEISLLDRGLLSEIDRRSSDEIMRARAARLGLIKVRGVIPHPPSVEVEGRDLLIRLADMAPKSLDRMEFASEAALLVLESGLGPEDAARLAAQNLKRFYRESRQWSELDEGRVRST